MKGCTKKSGHIKEVVGNATAFLHPRAGRSFTLSCGNTSDVIAKEWPRSGHTINRAWILNKFISHELLPWIRDSFLSVRNQHGHSLPNGCSCHFWDSYIPNCETVCRCDSGTGRLQISFLYGSLRTTKSNKVARFPFGSCYPSDGES